jgi:hypothetical protein
VKCDNAIPSTPAKEATMGKRPDHVKPPAHLSKSPPVPEPDPIDHVPENEEELSPTRYGDWVKKGIAIDF